MAFWSTENAAGVGPITDTGSTALHSLGRIVRGKDDVLGGAEFIYLAGVASTVVGALVTIREDGTTQLTTTTAERIGAPVAVAMSANNTSGSYGFYQIQGKALIKKGVVDFGLNAPIYASKVTAGRITVTAGSGNQIAGAITANSASVSSTTSTIYVMLNRPHLQTQGT